MAQEFISFIGPDIGFLFLSIYRPTDLEFWETGTTFADVVDAGYAAVAHVLTKKTIITGSFALWWTDISGLPQGSYLGLLTAGASSTPSANDSLLGSVDRFEWDGAPGRMVTNANLTQIQFAPVLATGYTLFGNTYAAIVADTRMMGGQAGAVDSQGRVILQPGQTFTNTTVPDLAAILSGITSLANWLRAMARNGTPDATALAELNSGGGTFDPTQHSEQAIRTRGNAAWEASPVGTLIDDINAELTGSHGPGDWNAAASLTITPLQGTTTSPTIAQRDIAIRQNEQRTVIWVLNDAAGNPVLLDGKAVRLTVYSSLDGGTTKTPGWTYDTTNQISVSGNNATVQFLAAQTATEAVYRYNLWNITDQIVLIEGKLTVGAAQLS